MTGAALPLIARLRRLGGPADVIVGEQAGVEGACAGAGIPPVSSVETSPLDELGVPRTSRA